MSTQQDSNYNEKRARLEVEKLELEIEQIQVSLGTDEHRWTRDYYLKTLALGISVTGSVLYFMLTEIFRYGD